MKKEIISILFITGLVFSACTNVENSIEEEVEDEVVVEEVSFELPEGWSRHPDDSRKATFGPLPPEDQEIGGPLVIVKVSSKGEGDADEARIVAQEHIDEAMQSLNPAMSQRMVDGYELNIIEKDSLLETELCDIGDTNIYFSKNGKVYLIHLFCDSMDKHMDMVEMVVSSI